MVYRVLLVDDEPIILDGLRTRFDALDRSAFPLEIVGTCGNGRDALAFLMEHPVDILLCDVRMPLMDGLALMKAMREADLRTRIIVVSGYADFAYAQEAMRAGAVDYLLKPIQAQPFQDALNVAMRAANEQQAASGGDGDIAEQEIARTAHDMPERTHQPPAHANAAAAVVAFIDGMDDPLSLEEIARKFGYHPVHLSRLIKRQTGMGFSQYLNQARLERAKKLLNSSELSITEIAHATGFNDLAYFCRVFKKQCGKTPHEYRNKS